MVRDIVIGKPIVGLDVLGVDEDPFFTNERFLPNILVELGVFKSKSEVRKNKPQLVVELNKLDCIDLIIGKKHQFYIVVGE